MAQKVYVNAIGTLLNINCQETMSGASKLALTILKPSGARARWLPTALGNYLKYYTVANDLNEAGTYYIQPYAKIGSWEGPGNTMSLKVYDLFK